MKWAALLGFVVWSIGAIIHWLEYEIEDARKATGYAFCFLVTSIVLHFM